MRFLSRKVYPCIYSIMSLNVYFLGKDDEMRVFPLSYRIPDTKVGVLFGRNLRTSPKQRFRRRAVPRGEAFWFCLGVNGTAWVGLEDELFSTRLKDGGLFGRVWKQGCLGRSWRRCCSENLKAGLFGWT